MTPTPEQTYLSTCPVCQNQIDVTSLEPFTKLKCPFCGQMVRVRRKFDHFIIVRQIGEGGMSRVFEAEDETLGRRVALKILNRQYSRDASRVEQFRQEALITANVNHPNVIKLYSVGYDQGYFYIAMELVNGGSLEQRIRREGTIKEEEALRIGREVAEGLRAAQQLGLIHRDVKPANILFTETGTSKVVDFGLALFVERGPDSSSEIWATPYYVAPEKIIDNREDYRSDIFSLGASLFHALTGRPPHKAESNNIQELRMIKCRRVALEDSGLRFAPRTIHVINRMVAFRPQERCANYDETVEELRLAEGLVGQGYKTRFSSRKLRWLGIAAAALVMAFIVGWLFRSTGDRAAVAITDTEDAYQDDLSGEGVTLQAGRETVAEKFLKARETMLVKKGFAQSRQQFEKLIDSGEARQPTLNWARFNAALCSIMISNRTDAMKHLKKMAEDTGEGSTLVSAELAGFFKSIGTRMGSNLALGTPLESLGYDTTQETVLGYLLHGLAEWHFGDAMLGLSELEFFAAHLGDVKTGPNAAALDWVQGYASVYDLYKTDLAVAKSVQNLASPKDLKGYRESLAAVKKAREKLRTGGAFKQSLIKLEAKINGEFVRLRMDLHRQQLAEDRVLRERELAQLAEITSVLPSLVQGYDYSRVVELLKDVRFQSPEVQSALEGRRYLYEQGQAFLSQLFMDISVQGYQGRLQRVGASTLEGRVTAADIRQVTVTLERGALTVPLDSISPESLLAAAQHFAEQVTDSTDYYQRQERIAVFARVTGLHSLSATVAAQLMEENRSFRSRWMKVVQ
ncbi:serine/threonine-protein kinase [Prosthecobacter sp. SYSU 5D2]|uniref:serine/threonine-protein kinase n=1 Tax=Prosthecobacter sp. SYSU 5D2 TaxID=3134134 RepID=UPI0031FF0D18